MGVCSERAVSNVAALTDRNEPCVFGDMQVMSILVYPAQR